MSFNINEYYTDISKGEILLAYKGSITSELMNEDLDPKCGILVIEKGKDGEYKVITGNFVSAAKTKFLKEKIEKINSLSKDELKDMYKFILNHQKISAKGGGGLGLVDIARKTGKKMEYNFYPYNDKYVFFDLQILI